MTNVYFRQLLQWIVDRRCQFLGWFFLICLRAVLIKIHKQEVRLFVPGFSCEVHEARKTVGHTRIKVIRPESVYDCNFLIQENDVYVAICFVFTTCNNEFYWISTSSLFLIGLEGIPSSLRGNMSCHFHIVSSHGFWVHSISTNSILWK